MKKKILIIVVATASIIILAGVYWLERGDSCFAQKPFYNCHAQNKFEEIDAEFINLSGQIGSLTEPSIFSVDKNERIFSFEHIKGEGGVGWTRIMKNGEVKNSLGFYTNYIDPIITPLSENTLIGSAWQWPIDHKLYNGPFSNYYLDFRTRETTELSTKGRLIAKSQDGQKVAFLESACVKERLRAEQLADCNNLDLSLRLIDLTSDLHGMMINHYYAMNRWTDQGPPYIGFLDFGQATFSPDGTKLAIEVKIEEIDYDTPTEYWTLFIADTKTREIIRQNNRLSKNRYEYVFWLDDENIIYW
jgi:hypothetical protein